MKLLLIISMMWTMSVQNLALAMMLLRPHIWWFFLIMWWLMAGVFWLQFYLFTKSKD